MTTTGRARADTAPEVRPRGSVARALRPFGYALIGTLWTAIGAVVLALGPGILAFLVYVDVTWDEKVTFGDQWQMIAGSGSEMVAFVLAIPLLALLWGPAVLWMLPCASIAPAALAWTYVGRSLRREFAGDALSYTTWGARGSTMGLAATRVALSLQPVHRSRWTDLLMRFYLEGWQISLRSLTAMLPAGFAWLLWLVATGVDVPGWLRVLFVVVGAALGAWSVMLLRRRWVARFTGGPGSDDGRRAVDLTAHERERRMRELRKLRAARRSSR